MLEKNLFLDLEGTIITPVISSWRDVDLINVNKIKSFIDEFQPTFVNVFSFAIWDSEDLQLFREFVQPRIESALDIKFSRTPTLATIQKAVASERGLLSLDSNELRTAYGKAGAFTNYSRFIFKNSCNRGLRTTAVLLDDDVGDTLIHHRDIDTQLLTLNIDNLQQGAIDAFNQVIQNHHR